MARLASPLPLVLALTLAGCGGEDRGRPQAAVSVEAGVGDPCQAAAGLQFQEIANFEGDKAECDLAVAPPTEMNATPHCFYLNYDDTTSPRFCAIPEAKACLQLDGAQAPDEMCVDTFPGKGAGLTDTMIEGNGRCGSSSRALHFIGQNLAVCINPATKRQGWGATLQVTFNWTPSGQAGTPYDARAWDGVSFWIRRGAGPTGNALLAAVQDVFTAAPPAPKGDGGVVYPMYCSVLPGDSDSKKCDPFGAAVLMTDAWHFVKLPFSQLQQKGFGVPAPTGRIDPAVLLGLQFGFSAGSWDLWLDDVAFYREAK
jgi:hypothetical protein